MTIARLASRLYYISHALGKLHPTLGYLTKQINHFLCGCDIAWQAQIGPGLRLFHPTGVVIGRFVIIGSECRLQASVTIGGHGLDDPAAGGSPTLGDRVRVGPGACIFGGINIGHDAVIGANAVVRDSIPAAHLAIGMPAKAIPL